MFFKHFASKNQLPGLSVSGTLVENGLIVLFKELALCIPRIYTGGESKGENVLEFFSIVQKKPIEIEFLKKIPEKGKGIKIIMFIMPSDPESLALQQFLRHLIYKVFNTRY